MLTSGYDCDLHSIYFFSPSHNLFHKNRISLSEEEPTVYKEIYDLGLKSYNIELMELKTNIMFTLSFYFHQFFEGNIVFCQLDPNLT